MRIGGLQTFSLIDYPEKISAVIFTQGCNFRCRYCYNPSLVDPQQFQPLIPEKDIMSFLKKGGYVNHTAPLNQITHEI